MAFVAPHGRAPLLPGTGHPGLCFCALLAIIGSFVHDEGRLVRMAVSRVVLVLATCLLAGYLVRQERQERQGFRLIVRNFYGVLRVEDSRDDLKYLERNLTHGTINHGSQAPGPRYAIHADFVLRAPAPASAAPSGRFSGVGDRFASGSIGLGAGVLTVILPRWRLLPCV